VRRLRSILCGLLFAAAVAFASAQNGPFAWSPVAPEELALKEVPGRPGLPAIILDRNIVSDDIADQTKATVRIKILTEAGRKMADIAIPYYDGAQHFQDLRARVVTPDGVSNEYTGKIYDRVLANKGNYRLFEKVLTFPDAQVGSILECHYELQGTYTRGVEWLVDGGLFIRHVKLTLRTSQGYALTWFRIPKPPDEDRNAHTITVEMNDVPPFVNEEYSPPEKELKMRVDVVYHSGLKSADEFWRDEADGWDRSIRDFLGNNPKEVRKVVDQLLQASDTVEQKLRKLYARAQQIRNLDFEPEREQEQWKKEHVTKANNNVDDVLKNGYGSRRQIDILFAAMVRAAGLEADVVPISERDDKFFDRNLLDGWQFDAEIVRVHLPDRDLFADPGTPFCPIGLLPWFRTGVAGLQHGEKKFSFFATPQAQAAMARTSRKLQLELLADGSLKGTVENTYSGIEALHLRIRFKNMDEAARRKVWEDMVKDHFAEGSTVTLDKVDGLADPNVMLRTQYSILVPRVGTRTKRRWIVPANLFEAAVAQPFENQKRSHPVYFSYPNQSVEDITLKFPAGYVMESGPEARQRIEQDFGYRFQFEKLGDQVVHVVRSVEMGRSYFPVESYPILRTFYGEVRDADALQIVLRSAGN